MSFTSGSGGNSGGLIMFFAGLAMMIGGGYMLTSNVIIRGGFWNMFGFNSFGITLIPLLIGVIILFYDSKMIIGWVVAGAGLLFIILGVIMQMHMYFKPTSLFNTILMLVLLFGGAGLILRSFKSNEPRKNEPEKGA